MYFLCHLVICPREYRMLVFSEIPGIHSNCMLGIQETVITTLVRLVSLGTKVTHNQYGATQSGLNQHGPNHSGLTVWRVCQNGLTEMASSIMMLTKILMLRWRQTHTAPFIYHTSPEYYVENKHHTYMFRNNVKEKYVANKPKRPHLYINIRSNTFKTNITFICLEIT